MAVKVLELHHHGIRVGPSPEAVATARKFYGDVLGLDHDPGRPTIPTIDGYWMDVGGTAQIHLMGVDGLSKFAKGPGQDPSHGVQIHGHGVGLQDPPPAVPEADDLVAVLTDPLANHCPDDCIETRAVTAAGQDADAHGGSSTGRSRGGRRLDGVMMPQVTVLHAGAA